MGCMTYLEGVKEACNKDESLESVDGGHEHNNSLLHVVVSLLSTQTDVQFQVCPERGEGANRREAGERNNRKVMLC